METIKIKSTHPESQGEFVILNKEDFDESKHELYGVEKNGAKRSEGLKVDEIKAELEKLGVEIPDDVTKKADLAALLDAQGD